MESGLLAPTQATPSDCVVFKRVRGKFQLGEYQSAWTEDRLSEEEAAYILRRANKSLKPSIIGITCMMMFWFALLLGGVLALITLTEKTEKDARGRALQGWIILVSASAVLFGIIWMKYVKWRRRLLKKIIDEENSEKLHLRGLHMEVGDKNKIITLNLRYEGNSHLFQPILQVDNQGGNSAT
eukprot:TRINITY_DN8314_c0_g1_i2.p1 TRINITY_DN8314_c0_g1~~TRINITY_DN8314_c0_g1_i2.p1  ORF type:complete len:183 (+),score=24.70 TRINITY_DN8314_c0_g1_i2:37-585(+)